MSLSVTIYYGTGVTNAAKDLTGRITPPLGGGLRFSTGPRGYAACELPFVPSTVAEGYEIYDWIGTPRLVVSYQGEAVWVGRVEQKRIVSGGFLLVAYGFARAMYDVPYTALWSNSLLREWRPVTESDNSAYDADQSHLQTNQGLFISLEHGATYPNGYIAGLMYELPDDSDTDLAQVSFDYETNLASDWDVRLRSHTADFATSTTEWTLSADGTTQSGSVDQAITAGRYIVTFEIIDDSGGPINYNDETGEEYFRVTSARVMGQATDVNADDIAAALVTYVNGENSDQLDSSTGAIDATTTDIQQAVYEDAMPGDILDDLAAAEGYEWGVGPGQRLYFRDEGSKGVTWYIDATAFEFGSDIDKLVTESYATYQDANGRTLRTATSEITGASSVWGITRRVKVNTRTTSSTEAEAVRDAFLTDRPQYALEASISFDTVKSEGGGLVPLWSIQAGDTVVINNIPPGTPSTVEALRSFIVQRTEWNNGVMRVEPKAPAPTLVTLVAGQ